MHHLEESGSHTFRLWGEVHLYSPRMRACVHMLRSTLLGVLRRRHNGNLKFCRHAVFGMIFFILIDVYQILDTKTHNLHPIEPKIQNLHPKYPKSQNLYPKSPQIPKPISQISEIPKPISQITPIPEPISQIPKWSKSQNPHPKLPNPKPQTPFQVFWTMHFVPS